MSLNKKLMGSMPQWNQGTFTGLIAVPPGGFVDIMASIEATRLAENIAPRPITFVRLTAGSGDILIGDLAALTAGGRGFEFLSMIGGVTAPYHAFDFQVGSGQPALTAVGAQLVNFIAYTD
jgi:tripartite-type tricarboxylate transporter receptor subunit TctC